MNESEWTTRKQRIDARLCSARLRREIGHVTTESGMGKGQFDTPAGVSRIMAKIIGVGGAKSGNQTLYGAEKTDGHLHFTLH
jgi:type I restriction enzyme M protein